MLKTVLVVCARQKYFDKPLTLEMFGMESTDASL
jgi:hypothetical protein